MSVLVCSLVYLVACWSMGLLVHSVSLLFVSVAACMYARILACVTACLVGC